MYICTVHMYVHVVYVLNNIQGNMMYIYRSDFVDVRTYVQCVCLGHYMCVQYVSYVCV